MGRRTNYGFEKRQREIKKQKKKEAKEERKRLKKEELEGLSAEPAADDLEVSDADVPDVIANDAEATDDEEVV